MTLDEVLAYIHKVDWRGSVPGLSRIDTLLGLLGHPERHVKYVHVTGTNGKGSTCAMLASVLRAAGYKTGLYTSPYIFRFNERMQINGAPIPDDTLCALVEELRPLADRMADPPTEFELVTAIGLTWFAPPISRTYALRYGDGGYVPDLDQVAKALEKLGSSRFPTRIIGFPSYLWFGLKRMEELGLRAQLPKGSRILLAGGWKQHYAQQVEKPVLYGLAGRILGIQEANINEFFGAVEHPIFFNACKEHHFHIPVYSRVIIRDVNTLEPLPMGKVGLINLISPLLRATPATSVMTDDLGYLTPGEECGCGLRSPYLTILGRVGLAEIQTCAAGAAELLGKGEMP